MADAYDVPLLRPHYDDSADYQLALDLTDPDDNCDGDDLDAERVMVNNS